MLIVSHINIHEEESANFREKVTRFFVTGHLFSLTCDFILHEWYTWPIRRRERQ